MRNKDFELLAPAGNLEIFKGVIESGADAVYVGGSMFGARAYANNFTEEELLEAIDFAHLRGVKVYLTVNTLIKNSEFSKLYDYLLVYYKRGLDAVIVQDIGVVKAIHEYLGYGGFSAGAGGFSGTFNTYEYTDDGDWSRWSAFSFTVWSDACGHGKGGFSCRDEAHT